MLHVVYFSTKPKDEIEFSVKLNLAQPNGRVMCQRLWERSLTTPTEGWREPKLNGQPFELFEWAYPQVPQEGELTLTYVVRLAIKPYAALALIISHTLALNPNSHPHHNPHRNHNHNHNRTRKHRHYRNHVPLTETLSETLNPTQTLTRRHLLRAPPSALHRFALICDPACTSN